VPNDLHGPLLLAYRSLLIICLISHPYLIL
jgi:hypothetical protein